MSHFAEINNDGVVQRVIVAEQDFINSGIVGDSFLWVQTSYNNNFRKNYAGKGYTYDKTRDAFLAPQPYPSWELDEDTCRWEAPTPLPDDALFVTLEKDEELGESGKKYDWDEDTTSWKEMK